MAMTPEQIRTLAGQRFAAVVASRATFLAAQIQASSDGAAALSEGQPKNALLKKAERDQERLDALVTKSSKQPGLLADHRAKSDAKQQKAKVAAEERLEEAKASFKKILDERNAASEVSVNASMRATSRNWPLW